MRADLLQFVKELSASDKKNLNQKVLKLMEEAGELAKVALPYEHAFGTNHRFVTPRRILEEAVDTILVALSVPYSLGFDDDDIAEMMRAKLDFWAELQARDSKVNDKTPYELHVTVSQVTDLEAFKRACAAIGVKPIVLDLHTANNGVLKDMMTSSVVFGRNQEALTQLDFIAKALEQAGFEVVRKKIETVPWHPAAPSRAHANPVMPKDCYFECHFAIQAQDTEACMAQLRDLAAAQECHLSRNVFKRHPDGSVTVMATYRSYDKVYEDVREHVERAANAFRLHNFPVDKELIEFSLYDTRIHHDAEWLLKA